MTFYWSMTGLHALHMVIGAGLLLWIIWRAWRGDFGPEYYGPVEIMGLYWHFVDIVWIFLFPFLYLIHGVAPWLTNTTIEHATRRTSTSRRCGSTSPSSSRSPSARC